MARPRPLAGCRAVELAQFIAGPTAPHATQPMTDHPMDKSPEDGAVLAPGTYVSKTGRTHVGPGLPMTAG